MKPCTLSLDGLWQVSEGIWDSPPTSFPSQVPVPGLITMAQPRKQMPLFGLGIDSANPVAYWYRREFELNEPLTDVALLKIHKSWYGSKVLVNGLLIGENPSAFTPGIYEVGKALKPGKNQLLIAIRHAPPPGYPSHDDYARVLPSGFRTPMHMPGIFDSVELRLTGSPYVANVQCAPHLASSSIRVRLEFVNSSKRSVTFAPRYSIRTWKEGKQVATRNGDALTLAAEEVKVVETEVTIPKPRLWSPEDPFLYEMVSETGADTQVTRFGMREFCFTGGKALLNGKPYFLRGTNVVLYRFFSDQECRDLPWREEWVHRLYSQFRSMHWNSFRTHIGFAPDFWYDLADEMGLLIQDEYPIWPLGKEVTTEILMREYIGWMRQRWNHPSVVIWDAQNENPDSQGVIAAAIHAVRGMDMQNRIWDNGFATPDRPDDLCEYHPYFFRFATFHSLANFAENDQNRTRITSTHGNKVGPQRPIILNEYGYMWLNMQGEAAAATKSVYDFALGPDQSPVQRQTFYARWLAAKTEYWRSVRWLAGLQHFCSLNRSKDSFNGVPFLTFETLSWEPQFWRYVRGSFAPVGIMLDWWREEVPAAEAAEWTIPWKVPLIVTNDLDQAQTLNVNIRLSSTEGDIYELTSAEVVTLAETQWSGIVPALGQVRVEALLPIAPQAPGYYRIEAAYTTAEAEVVRSVRDLWIYRPGKRRNRDGIATGCTVTSNYDQKEFPACNAVDGRHDTVWKAEETLSEKAQTDGEGWSQYMKTVGGGSFKLPRWLTVALAKPTDISHVQILWDDLIWNGGDAASNREFTVDVSGDGKEWTTVAAVKLSFGRSETVYFNPVKACYVRLMCLRGSGPKDPFNVREFRIYP